RGASSSEDTIGRHYVDYLKEQLDVLVNRCDFVINNGHIDLSLEPQKRNFIETLEPFTPLQVVTSMRQFLESTLRSGYKWQNGNYTVPGASLKVFRQLLMEAEGQPRFDRQQLETCFEVFAVNMHERLKHLSPQIQAPSHIKPHGVDPKHPPVFLMCPPNMHSTTENAGMFRNSPSYVGRLYLWSLMKNAIEAAGGKVSLVEPTKSAKSERSVFVRDVLIRDTHGVIICPQWSDGIIDVEQKPMLEAIAHQSPKARVRVVQAGIENGNIATDHKRHVLFLGYDNAKILAEDAAALQKKTKSRVIPVLIKRELSDKLYHLDFCLTELEPGQFIWCPKAFSRESRALIEQNIPESDRIAVDLHAARLGACNCVTIGKTVITPMATPEMRQQLENKGYHVETSASLGLPKGGLLKFGLGAIHCTTFYLGDNSPSRN
ncbi:MAG: hypothetical protein EBV03_08215, partial [Proteobacteria bacterium]|nr:hypothetical protein [Pseudomonadota bacterium]